MRAANFGRAVVVGIGLALAATIPATSQAREGVNKHQAASARRNSVTESYGLRKAGHKALDGGWNVAPRRYGMH